MGNQNQNQYNNNPNNNNNSQNNNQNDCSAPTNANGNNDLNTVNDQITNANNNSSENENPNRIIEENNNSGENKINENPENQQNQQNQQNPENQENLENNGAPPTNENNSDCPVPADISTYEKHFSFNGLMDKIKETAKKAGLKAIYMALLLYYALESPTITTMDKAIIYGALGYFISPIDIVPDILPLIGLTDDIAVLAWAFSRVKKHITDMTREKAKTKLKIWFGNFDEKEIDDL